MATGTSTTSTSATSSTSTSSNASTSSAPATGQDTLQKCKEDIALVFHNCTPEFTVEAILPLLQPSKDEKESDFAVAVPAIKGKLKYKGDPLEVAKKWQSASQGAPEAIQSCTIAEGKMTFLHIKMNKQKFVKLTLQRIFTEGRKYGLSGQFVGKKILVEYSSPNIAKPFHAGHLRSTIIGNVLKNLYRTLGAETVSINYLGDWGKQYGLLAIGFEKYGDNEKLEASAIEHLNDIYVKISADKETDKSIDQAARDYFKRMEDGDPKALALWERFRNISIEDYKRTYKRLNVEFDVYDGESQQQQKMGEVVKLLADKGLLKTEADGSQTIDLSAYSLNVVIIRKKDGATLYITRDIAAAVSRWEKWHFDKLIYVVAAPQNLHFKQLFKILELMGYTWVNRCVHVNFGMVALPKDEEGHHVAMSTRKGNVILLEKILTMAQHTIHEKILEDSKGKLEEITKERGGDPHALADLIGLAAVVVQDLSAKRIKDYEFQVKRVTNYQGYTGPFLEYTFARLCSMRDHNQAVSVHPDVKFELITEESAHQVVMALARLPEVLQATESTLEPCTLVQYMFELCHAVSVAHKELWILNQSHDVQQARMLLFHCARIVLENCIKLLGLVPVERM